MEGIYTRKEKRKRRDERRDKSEELEGKTKAHMREGGYSLLQQKSSR